MMQGFPSWIAYSLLLIGTVSAITAAEQGLSEIQKMKAENFKLKTQLVQCQLNVEQAALTSEFAKTLNAPVGSQFNWNSLSFSTNSLTAESTLQKEKK